MSVALVRSLSRQLTTERSGVAALDAYYAGTQPLAFLDPKVRAASAGRLQNVSVNWCRVVIGALEERLDVEGFRVAGNDEPIPALWRYWQAADLDEFSGLCHVDALVHGRSFALVWYGEDEAPSITVETAREMTVSYIPGTRRVGAALKEWREDDRTVRSVLYLPDRVERYVTDGQGTRLDGDMAITGHDLGEVPVVPFINQPRLGSTDGESELSDVVPLVDAIGKCATDLLVSAEYHAMPRRWATGLSLPPAGNAEEVERTREVVRQQWQQAEAGRVWLERNESARFGQFQEATLDNFISAIRMFTEQIAALAKLPPHMLGVNTANPASADAIRSAESGLVKKVQRKQRGFGGSWERVMRLADRVATGTSSPNMTTLETIWRDAETPTVAQKADAGVKLLQAGAITKAQLREDMGYTPTQIKRMQDDEARDALGPVSAQIAEANRLVAEDGLSRPAAYAAVGLLQAAGQMSADGA